jgi:hypothetical protein
MLPRGLGQEAAAIAGDAVDRRDEALVQSHVQADRLARALGADEEERFARALFALGPRLRGDDERSRVGMTKEGAWDDERRISLDGVGVARLGRRLARAGGFEQVAGERLLARSAPLPAPSARRKCSRADRGSTR